MNRLHTPLRSLLIRKNQATGLRLALFQGLCCVFLLDLILIHGVAIVEARQETFPAFEHQTIDPQIDKVCYGLTLADVNGDHKIDLVAVSNRAVYWYQNPTWKKHRIIADQTIKDNVCIAPHDIDGDGRVEFALGAGWTGTGTIQWLSRPKQEGKPWNVHLIDKIRWTHRMRFADVLDKGKPQLVVSPLNKISGNGVALTAYEIPTNPAQDRWPKTVLNNRFNRLHNHWHIDADDDGRMDTATASEEGVHLIRKSVDGFSVEKISDRPAGEIKFGRFLDGARLLATIEPMHGNEAVVYADIGGKPTRMVLDKELKQGHAVWLTNLDGDAEDEVIIGHREAGTGKIRGPGLYVFDYNSQTKQWVKQVIDDGDCAVEDALAADFNGDGRIDIAAGGRSTHNVKIYWNRGPQLKKD